MAVEGEPAPDFTLEGYGEDDVQTFTLSDVLTEGKPAVLTFYIYDYSPVCTDQMCEVNDMEFLTFNPDVAVFGISTDGPYSHRQFATDNSLSYPLLSDPHKEVYEGYGMVEQGETGRTEPKRGIVVVDTEQTIQYRWEAADNWDPWQTKALEDANEVVESLTAE